MSNITRRSFIQTLTTTIAAPAIVFGRKRARRLPIAFSTLGCPKWDWATILRWADQLGYAAIELRGIQGEMDLTKRPEFSATRLKQSLQDLAALDLKISDLGASVRCHEPEPTKLAAQLDEGRRFIDLAHRMKVPYVRVFGDKFVPGEPRQVTIDRVIKSLRTLGEHAKDSKVTVILETHGDFTASPVVLQLMQGANLPTVALLWDAHHTFAAGKEAPAHTYQQLAPYIKHTHLKDSRPEANERRYVLTGQGDVPVREQVHVLAKAGYRGYYCFEWEKAWHPEIPEPEVAFPHYAETIRQYLAEAGIKG